MPSSRTAFLIVSMSTILLTLGCGERTGTSSPQEDPVKRTTSATKAPKPASEISFKQEEPWYSIDASFRSMIDFDQAVTQTESPFRAYRPTAAYTAATDWSKLVLDLYCSSDDRAPDAPASLDPNPLASLDAVQVFGEDRTKPIAVFSRADLVVQRGTTNGFEHDGRGPIIMTIERVRLPFSQFSQLIRDGHPYRLTVVGLDAQGRTMTCDDIDGDEAEEAIAPQPLPESGWDPAQKGDDSQPAASSVSSDGRRSGGIVSRSHVVGMAYDAGIQVLHVRLASGIYRYDLVPKDVAARFAAAKDQEAFYQKHIENGYPGMHMTPATSGYAVAVQALKGTSGGATDDAVPASVGTATMKADGTLHLQLRSETASGIAESLLIVAPTDKRYAGMVEHLGGIKPGESRSIPPFPETTLEPGKTP